MPCSSYSGIGPIRSQPIDYLRHTAEPWTGTMARGQSLPRKDMRKVIGTQRDREGKEWEDAPQRLGRTTQDASSREATGFQPHGRGDSLCARHAGGHDGAGPDRDPKAATQGPVSQCSTRRVCTSPTAIHGDTD